MTDLAFILLTMAFFAAVAVVARRAATHESAVHEPAAAYSTVHEPAARDSSVAPLGRRK
jgi:hypothetical protein